MKKTILLSLLFVALIPAFFTSPSPKRPKHFSLNAISASIPFHPEWETRELRLEEMSEVDKALSQPYLYLGGGGQCFCFESSDHKYVIKFFKQKAFDPPAWMESNAVPFLVHWLRERKIAKGEVKRSRVFDAFRQSFETLQQETGLLYVHLNKTDHLKKTVHFTDVEGKEHALDVDNLEFVVQRKGQMATELLDICMHNQDIAGAERAIDQLLALQLTFHRKGYRNRDPNFRGNYGFLDGRAFAIDIGRITPLKNKTDLMEFDRATRKLRLHISARHPALLAYFDQSLSEMKKT